MKINYALNLILIIIVTILISLFYSNYIETDVLLRSYFSDKYSEEIINNYFYNKNKWSWLSYLLIPILIFLKVVIISYTLYIVTSLYNISEREHYPLKPFLESVSNTEWINVLPALFKMLYFIFIEKFTAEDLINFEFFSLKSLLPNSNLESWQEYPLRIMDIWTFLYMFILTFYIKDFLNIGYSKAFKITATSCFPLLFIWTVFVMYLLLNIY